MSPLRVSKGYAEGRGSDTGHDADELEWAVVQGGHGTAGDNSGVTYQRDAELREGEQRSFAQMSDELMGQEV